MKPKISNFPSELLALPQWVLWRFEHRDGKLTKLPYNAKTGKLAKANDPSTWSTLVKCLNKIDEYDGIGFELRKENGFIIIDFDDCRDSETGEIDPETCEWVNKLNSYTEISASGNGLHVIVKGGVPGPRRVKTNALGCSRVEMYDEGHFFVMTGALL